MNSVENSLLFEAGGSGGSFKPPVYVCSWLHLKVTATAPLPAL